MTGLAIIAGWFGFGMHDTIRHFAAQAAVLAISFGTLPVSPTISLLPISRCSLTKCRLRQETAFFPAGRGARCSHLRFRAPATGTLKLDPAALVAPDRPAATEPELSRSGLGRARHQSPASLRRTAGRFMA